MGVMATQLECELWFERTKVQILIASMVVI